MAIKYINIFSSKALQNIPEFGFLVRKLYHLATLVQMLLHRARHGTDFFPSKVFVPNLLLQTFTQTFKRLSHFLAKCG
jgi:hypothetical protein